MKKVKSMSLASALVLIALTACTAGYSSAGVESPPQAAPNNEPKVSAPGTAQQASATNSAQPADRAAQQPAQQASSAPMLVVPVIMEYNFASKYFLQWVKDDPHYSMIDVMVSEGKSPIYEVTLTENPSGQRVTYCNSMPLVKAMTGRGKTAHYTPIQYRLTESVGEQPTHQFVFRDQAGRTITWKFIPASDPSERGGGLTPGRRKGLSFYIRKLGTAAGEGTALQIDSKVNNAEPWPQISSPPYFVAFRGSYSMESEFGSLAVGSEAWHVKSAPSALTKGAQWTLVNDHNGERTFRIASRKGDEITINEESSNGPDSATLSLIARETPEGLAISSITARDQNHSMKVSFTPELKVTPNGSDAAGPEVAFQINLSGSGKVSEGTVATKKSGNTVTLRWQPRSPDWAKARTLNTSIAFDPNGYKIDVQ